MISLNTASLEVMSQTKSEPPACRCFFSWGRCEGFIMNQERLQQLLHYCPETGVFIWRARKRGVTVGRVAGNLDRYGYWYITLGHKRYVAHRLAWLYFYGAWPSECIDHINRVRTDNRIRNLRQATHAQNRQNLTLDFRNKSGFRGVSFDAVNNKWRASISVNGKAKNLGRYTTKEAAASAYADAAATYHTHNLTGQT
jgi:hypothetical protein